MRVFATSVNTTVLRVHALHNLDRASRTGTTRRARSNLRHKKKFAPDRSQAHQRPRNGAKTRESPRPIRARVRANDTFADRCRHLAASSSANFESAFGAQSAPCLSRGHINRRDSSGADLLPQEIVDGLRIRLAAGSLHHLTDEPADRLRILCRIGDLVRILGDDLVNQLFNGRNVGHLLQATLLDNRKRYEGMAREGLAVPEGYLRSPDGYRLYERRGELSQKLRADVRANREWLLKSVLYR